MLLTGTAYAQTSEIVAPELESSAQSADEGLKRSVSHLFEETLTDFRRLPSRDTMTWLSVGAAAAAPYYGGPCLRQQQVIDAWGYARWTYVRVC